MSTMRGRTCLVTGGTNGIGKSTALRLARLGATVVITGRNAEKTARVVEELRAASGNDAVDALLADLSSQGEVRRLAAEFRTRYPHLHVLIHNAGAFFLRRQVSVDGIEMTLAVNHLASFLLTDLLLGTLRASAPARIVVVSSAVHASGRIDFGDLQGERRYRPRAYDDSKLANLLFTTELARRLEGTGVTVNALHPGFVATGFAKNNGRLVAALVSLLAPLVARSPHKGAATSVHLASSPSVAGTTGKYFYDSHEVPPARHAGDVDVAARLWEASARLVGVQPSSPTGREGSGGTLATGRRTHANARAADSVARPSLDE